MKTNLKNSSKSSVWNKGLVIGQKPPLSKKDFKAIASKLKSAGRLRELVLFNLAIESSLGATDLVRLKLKDLSVRGVIAEHVSIISTQTNYEVQFELSETTRDLIAEWVELNQLKPNSYLFFSRISSSPHISSRQYARMVAEWISLIGLDPRDYSSQSLRRTKPMLIYSKTNDLSAAMSQLGHARLRSTARFLGIS